MKMIESYFDPFCIVRIYTEKLDVRGRVVKVVNFKPLALHRCGFESKHGLWILFMEEAIQPA
jgi:hypothetical protein